MPCYRPTKCSPKCTELQTLHWTAAAATRCKSSKETTMSSNVHESSDDRAVNGNLTTAAGSPVVDNNNILTAGAPPHAATRHLVPRKAATLRPRGHP